MNGDNRQGLTALAVALIGGLIFSASIRWYTSKVVAIQMNEIQYLRGNDQ